MTGRDGSAVSGNGSGNGPGVRLDISQGALFPAVEHLNLFLWSYWEVYKHPTIFDLMNSNMHIFLHFSVLKLGCFLQSVTYNSLISSVISFLVVYKIMACGGR